MNGIRLGLAALAWIGLSTAAACGGGGGGSAAATPVGAWQYQSGTLWSDEGAGTLTFFEFHADGSGAVFSASGAGMLGCAPMVYAAVSDEVLFVDVPALELNRLYRWTLENDTLTLTDEQGRATVFARADEVAPQARCEVPVIAEEAPLPYIPEYFSGLVDDGSMLWYEDSTSRILSIDPASWSTGASFTFTSTQYRHVQTFQMGDFWSHCGCGGSQSVERRTPGNVLVDTIDTDVDLGHRIGVRGAAWDGSSLWLSGYSYDDAATHLLEVNSGAEPDVLVSALLIDAYLEGLSFDGTDFWALGWLMGPALVRIDVATGQITRTISLPDTHQWRGLVVRPEAAFVLGLSEDYDQGTVLELTL